MPCLSVSQHVGSARLVCVAVSLPLSVVAPIPTPDGHIRHGQLAGGELYWLAAVAREACSGHGKEQQCMLRADECGSGSGSTPSLSAGEHVGSADPVWVPVPL